MPKSSSATLTPSSFRRCSVARLPAEFTSSTDSVISSSSRRAGRPEVASADSTSDTSAPLVNWLADRLTATVSWSSQRIASAQASCSVKAPSSWIRPVSSAMGMKSWGRMSPLVGCCQRISASRPTMRTWLTSMIGW
ncbi:hypothetical protein D3C72_1926870 [compost metagenome]